MKKGLTLLFFGVSICTLLSCTSSPQTLASETEAVEEEAGVSAETEHAASAKAARSQDGFSVRFEASKRGASKASTVEAPQAEPAEALANDEQSEARPVEMKVAHALDRNPYLSSRLTPLLPKRATVVDAAAGFKNQRQFIAALHVSKNLDIPFDQLKTRMTAAEDRMSLSEALREIRPEMTKNLANAEVKKGEAQAKDDESQAKEEGKRAVAEEKLAANGKLE